jgi:hypothetical protein
MQVRSAVNSIKTLEQQIGSSFIPRGFWLMNFLPMATLSIAQTTDLTIPLKMNYMPAALI